MQQFTKICTVCTMPLPLCEYYNSSVTKDGKAYRCKTCDNEARKRYGLRHRNRLLENQRKANRKYKYGLSEEEYTKIIDNQKGLCGCCGVEMTQTQGNKHKATTLCIDHDHRTGKIRGLLCTKCNKGIGLLGDSPQSLQKALEYLQEKG